MAEKKIVDMSKAHVQIMDAFVTAFETVLEQIEEQCAIDQENIRHTGQWALVSEREDSAAEYECTNCGQRLWNKDDGDHKWKKCLRYCPNCGAKMEEWQ